MIDSLAIMDFKFLKTFLMNDLCFNILFPVTFPHWGCPMILILISQIDHTHLWVMCHNPRQCLHYPEVQPRDNHKLMGYIGA